MARLQPAAECGDWPIHKDWRDAWAPDLKPAALKHAIWENSRFSVRITAGLLAENGAPDELVALEPEAARILSTALRQMKGDTFRKLGLMWCAPVLAPLLLNATSRAEIGALSKPEMALIHSTRDHAPADLVGPTCDAEGIEAEGQTCFAGWLSTLPPSVQHRTTLLLPKPAQSGPEAEGKAAARAAIVVRHFTSAEPSKGAKQ